MAVSSIRFGGCGANGGRAYFGYVRSAPGTYAYLFVLLITSWVLQTSSSRIANALLQERSTNLHHLATDPLRVLFSSAFWVGSFADWVVWVALFSIFVAPVERWIGTGRTAIVFVLGHVGATLITAARALGGAPVQTSSSRPSRTRATSAPATASPRSPPCSRIDSRGGGDCCTPRGSSGSRA